MQMNGSALYNKYNNAWSITLCFLVVAFVIMLPDLASATTASGTPSKDENNLTKVICNVINMLQGNIARGVAAFGIIFLGFSLFLGKISWGTAFALAIGLGAIFGAQALVNLMSGSGTLDCASGAGAVQ